MRAYSPPLTRQRARALYIAQVHNSDDSGVVLGTRGDRGTRNGRRSTSEGIPVAEAKEAFSTRRGPGTDFKPAPRQQRFRGRGGRRTGNRRRGGDGTVEPLTADSRPKPASTLGNSRSRCRKGGDGGPAPTGVALRGGAGVGGSGGVVGGGGAAAGAGGGKLGVGRGVLVAPSPSASVSSPPPPPLPRPSATTAGVTSSSSLSGAVVAVGQPLEEASPSVLNAKSGRSSDGVGEKERREEGEEGMTSGVGGSTKGRGGGGEEVEAFEGTVDGGGGSRGKGLPAPPGTGVDGVGGGVLAGAAGGADGTNKGGGVGSVGGKHAALSAATGAEKPPRVSGGGVVAAGSASEVGAARLRDKSSNEKGSTGVSPMLKRNRRELKLSEEETAMAGAPQGPVYQVAVLETDEFEASLNPEDEMRAVRTASAGAGDWADLYSAVDSSRRLCIFHREVILRDGNLEGAVELIVVALGNLRSSTVRNALLGVGDMFRLLGHDMARVDIRPMVTGTLQRLAGDKRFICQTAAQAMEVGARSGPSLDVLHAILPGMDDRNAEVSAKSAFYAEQCLATLGVGAKAGSGLPDGLDLSGLLAGLSRVVNGKVAEGRTAARRGLLRSRKAMGPEPFKAAVTEVLGNSEATGLLAALVASSRGPASGSSRGIRGASGRGGGSQAGGAGAGARPSIREQMMASRRKQEDERRAMVAAASVGPGGGGAGGGAQGEAGDPAVNVAAGSGVVDGFVIVT